MIDGLLDASGLPRCASGARAVHDWANGADRAEAFGVLSGLLGTSRNRRTIPGPRTRNAGCYEVGTRNDGHYRRLSGMPTQTNAGNRSHSARQAGHPRTSDRQLLAQTCACDEILSSGSDLRAAGNVTTYAYYGNSETKDNPCTGPVENWNQAVVAQCLGAPRTVEPKGRPPSLLNGISRGWLLFAPSSRRSGGGRRSRCPDRSRCRPAVGGPSPAAARRTSGSRGGLRSRSRPAGRARTRRLGAWSPRRRAL